ncbi:MAG: PQQ-dependent sugar dehydrogenase, partial [Phaeodactylibacter sp.]|nr:PQQ-dependent sugar dehydrogenase [Phaeodactylibacter sp.]
MRSLLLLVSVFLGGAIYAQPSLQLEVFASGFSLPVDIAHAGDGRLFIVEKAGRIRIIDSDGSILPQPFLDIDARVNSLASERGLLGLAFHPDYTDNGYFFVNYTNNSGDTRISRFSVSAGNANQADPNSERILLEVDQPFNNHNAGDLNFGPDGYLYIGLGDGGSADDPGNRAQNRQNLLGKMLRIDVDNGDPYSIPEDNPFAFDDFTLDEIWAIGLRNPWRFSFDRLTGALWIADV